MKKFVTNKGIITSYFSLLQWHEDMVNFVTMLRQQQSKFTKLTVKIGTAITDTCFESEPVNEKIKMVGLFKIKNIFT